jgi:hypothetical protein
LVLITMAVISNAGPVGGTIVTLGRGWCPACLRYLTLVKHPDTTEIACPRCNGPVEFGVRD